jgi:2-amino-4-hydroxy-6-hydroxymethyldihydropteridine diphosphokinase
VSRAVLSVGSNLGDRLAFLQSCVDGLQDVLLAASGVYQTAPWGPETADPVVQGDFYNAVLLVAEDGTGPRGWLDRARGLEAAAGRRRGQRWGPRTLDVDVVTVDNVRSADPELTLPHPRAHERAFVLVPWLEVEPDAVLPEHGPLVDLVRRVDRTGVRLRPDLVLQVGPARGGAGIGGTGVSR